MGKIASYTEREGLGSWLAIGKERFGKVTRYRERESWGRLLAIEKEKVGEGC